MLALAPVTPPGDAVDDAKTWLRIDHEDEDALLGSLIAVALRQCEAFCGMVLLRRSFTDRIEASGAWQRVHVTPVMAITGVIGVPEVGAPVALSVSDYAVDIDSNGDGWVRLTGTVAVRRIDVTGIAGLAADWGGVAETLRQGMLRLVAHLHAVRDNPDDLGPPAAVAALWRPWRRMRLG